MARIAGGCNLVTFLTGSLALFILRSTFLPRTLGVLLAFGGLGWLTFLSASFASDLFPYNLFPGIVGQGCLTLRLLLRGVNEQRWKEQASLAGSA
ncbi:MAG: hypothetical protein SGJ01_10375 [Gemmatimonadota bacterium]|nr:hypothetical protein [Gemmatimonadota bacterium]MDZ4863838.1 hypothetical protein [Gemmatimonadota bacterium]